MGDTEYERYIRTNELFEQLRPVDNLAAHDELIFQVTHQTAELWMQVALHDVRGAVKHVEADELAEAADLFTRVAIIEEHLTKQLAILERMPPKQYVHIRRTLGRGSGQESPGFNALLKMGEMIWPSVKALIERRGVSIVEVLDEPEKHYDLHVLYRSLYELDQNFRTWRFVHFRMVERQIGGFVDSLKGVPAEQLVHGMREHLLPELWAAVNDFTKKVNAEARERGESTQYS
ncbi:MAG: tryptophan 2,3-dioxygenase family protein [Deltaproteobacteria bacterium]